jgi:hypothetical protein
MIYECQRDPRWSQKRLGSSFLTIGRYGCTTTAISMLTDYFHCFLSPDQIAAQVSWYTPQGLILWQNMKFAKMKFDRRIYGRNDAAIRDSIAGPNKAVLLQVDNGSHWVVAVSKTLFGNDYVCIDPWTGTKCNVIAKYGNITGSAHFTAQ